MILVTNFKTYPESTGEKAFLLAKLHEEVAKETGKEIIIAVQPADILRVSHLEIPVFAQHVDPIEQGRNTGFITPESVKEAGAAGVRATALCPGEVDTPILDDRPQPVDSGRRARILQPEDVAAAVVFAASLPDRACVAEMVLTPTLQGFR